MRSVMRYIVVLLAVSALAIAADDKAADTTATVAKPAAEQDSTQSVTLPAKDTGEYWDLRSHAVTELTGLITTKRAEMKEKLDSATRFLAQEGLTLQFNQSKITLPDDPAIYFKALGVTGEFLKANTQGFSPKKPLEWETLIELAMKYVVVDGYDAAVVADKEEIAYLKNSCEMKEKYTLKARKEFRDQINKIVSIWLFLGTAEKQQAMSDFYIAEQTQKKQAQADRIKQGQEALKNQERAIQEQRRIDKENLNRQRRNDRYYNRYYYSW
jgi:hypothetical protein